MKKILLFVLAVILMLNTAIAAEFSAENAYAWLSSRAASDGSYSDIPTTAWAVLAFDGSGNLEKAENSLGWIFSQQSGGYCFPNSCKVKDTAMAIIAMNKLQRVDNMTEIQESLKEMLIASSLSGKWLLEVSTTATGTCKFSWAANNVTRDKTVAVDKGKFSDCGNGYFMDIDTCLSSAILRNPGTVISADCTGLADSNKVITLVYRNSNNFYILSSATGDKADLPVNNGCFGTIKGDSVCRKEPTLYAGWAVKESLAQGIDTKIYLMDSYSDSSAEDNSLLYRATKDARYLPILKSLQKTDGSFDKSVMKTALAVLALKEDSASAEQVAKATEWLKKSQKADGSLGTEMETAAALYAAFNQPVEIPSNFTPESICNGNGNCEADRGEDTTNCPEDCETIEEPITDLSNECNSDSTCDAENGETSENCADCSCGDGVCDDFEKDDGSCAEDCPVEEPAADDTTQPTTDKGTSFTTWLIIALIVLIVIAGGIFGMRKLGLSKPKAKPGSPGYNFPRPIGMPPASPSKVPPMKQMQRPYMPSPRKGKDEELDKSLAEARKLLGK